MAEYEYKEGKTRIENALDCEEKPIGTISFANEKESPTDIYEGWLCVLCVNISNYSDVIYLNPESKISKIVKCLLNELMQCIEEKNLIEVKFLAGNFYAMYSAPFQSDVYDVADMAITINTFFKMFNKILSEREHPILKFGIGVSLSKDLCLKGLTKKGNLDKYIWIGEAMTEANKLAVACQDKEKNGIAYSTMAYSNFIDEMEKDVKNEDVKHWFTMEYAPEIGDYYCANLVKKTFNNWIKNDLK